MGGGETEREGTRVLALLGPRAASELGIKGPIRLTVFHVHFSFSFLDIHPLTLYSLGKY